MNEDQGIPREVEGQFRDALGHAAKRRVSELRSLLRGLVDKGQIDAAVQLCGLVTAYTAIDVVERRWPTDAGIRRMAQKVAQSKADAPYGVTEENAYLFLSRVALGSESYADAFSDAFDDADQFAAVPFFLTVNMLATFGAEGKTVWEFLDVIEDSYEKAWLLDLNLLPALMVRSRMPQPEQGSGGPQG